MGTRVYIGRLPYGVRERDIEKFFKGYGKLSEILLKRDFGFVEFEDHRDADDAVYELNGKDLLGERIVVEFARRAPRGPPEWRDRGGDGYDRDRYNRQYSRRPPPANKDHYGPPTRTDYRLIVENLSSRCNWQDLKDIMREAGEITYADAHKNRRNEGVVEFASYRDMKRAIEKLDGIEVNGRRIKLIEDNYSQDRASYSKSRSRSRSVSHTRRHAGRYQSRSPSRSISRSKSRSSRSRSGSQSFRSHTKSRSRSPRNASSRERSNSGSPEYNNHSKSRSRSPSLRDEIVNGSKSQSNSRSPSIADNGKSLSPNNIDERSGSN